jgi:hypothetical protein
LGSSFARDANPDIVLNQDVDGEKEEEKIEMEGANR